MGNVMRDVVAAFRDAFARPIEATTAEAAALDEEWNLAIK